MPQLTMPNVGEGVTEGTVTSWLKHEGDHVALDEPVVEVETDKAVVEIPSPFAGRLAKIIVEEGAVVPIGAPLAEFDVAGSETPAADTREPAPKQEPAAVGASASDAAEETAGRAAVQSGAPDGRVNGSVRSGSDESPPAGMTRTRQYSPVVLRLAAEHNIDLSLVQGSGIEGRVTRQDVMAYIENPVMHTVPPGAGSGIVGVSHEQKEQAPTPAVPETGARQAAQPAPARAGDGDEPATPPTTEKQPPADDRDERVPLTATRRTIAARMLESQRTVPPAWMVVEADVTGLVVLRERLKADFERSETVSLTYMPFFVQAIVGALKEHPAVNSTYGEREIIVHRRYDIGVAVAAESGLVVPVLRDADRKSIAGLAHELHELGTKARARKLSVDEMRAPTFTVDNTGAFGSIVSQPIVPPGQAAIITTEAIRRELRVSDDGSFGVRSVVNLCISFDHRALDGAQVGVFMQAVRARLEAYRGEQTL